MSSDVGKATEGLENESFDVGEATERLENERSSSKIARLEVTNILFNYEKVGGK